MTDNRATDIEALHKQLDDLSQRLEVVEAQYQAISDNGNIYICRLLPGGEIQFANQAFYRDALAAFKPDHAVDFLAYIGEPAAADIAQQIKALSPGRPEFDFVHSALAEDNLRNWQQWTCRGFFDNQGSLVEIQAVGHDITALKQAEAIAEQHNRELSALHTATRALLSTLNSEVLLGQILDAAIGALPAAQKGTLHLIAKDTGQLELRASRGYADPRIKKFSYSETNGYVARAVRERRPLMYRDAAGEIPNPRRDLIPEMNSIHSVIVAPLVLQERILGAISLESPSVGAFTDSDLRLLVSFAITATNAIHNAELHSEAQKSAITDALTGLYNRRGFFELGQREIERSFRFKHPLTAVMIDVDNFKYINDHYGHITGDLVLRSIAARCSKGLRKVDILGRYGGDEFILLLPETHVRMGGLVAERLRRNVSETRLSVEEHLLRVSISLGVAGLTTEVTDLDMLISRADAAMYAAKQAGRNRIMPM